MVMILLHINLKLVPENIKIKEVVTLDSPNYQLIYLDLINSKPEQFNIISEDPKELYSEI